MKYKVIVKSEFETIAFAQELAGELFPNMLICLEGDLGSGKTVFAKAFAATLGVTEVVTSPTFNIIKEYKSGKLPFYHIDIYRLNGQIENLDLESYFHKEGIIIIEWADLIRDYLPTPRLEIKIKITGDNSRVLIIKPIGTKYEEICEALL